MHADKLKQRNTSTNSGTNENDRPVEHGNVIQTQGSLEAGCRKYTGHISKPDKKRLVRPRMQ